MEKEINQLAEITNWILEEATKLKDKHTNGVDAIANYVCVFCQNDEELVHFNAAAARLGPCVLKTGTGNVFHVSKTNPVGSTPKLLKIRKPDETRTERGDADFTVDDYSGFKQRFVNSPGFTLIPLKGAEMIELVDKDFDVRVYFSDPPLDVDLQL